MILLLPHKNFILLLRLLLLLLLIYPWCFIFPIYGTDPYEEGKKFAEEQLKQKKDRRNDKAILRSAVADLKPSGTPNEERLALENKRCVLSSSVVSDPLPSLYVFMSFSLPEQVWLSLSKEMESRGGVFVLRGLPQNSFGLLGKKIYDLRKKGMKGTVQIDPRLFIKYSVDKVPCFVFQERENYNKTTGNISLEFALEKITEKSTSATAFDSFSPDVVEPLVRRLDYFSSIFS